LTLNLNTEATGIFLEVILSDYWLIKVVPCVSFTHELVLYLSESEFIMQIDIGVQLSIFHRNWKEQFGNPLLQAVTKSLSVALQTCPSNAVALSS